jgi:DNA-binding XRE family transcriptional regulator
MSCYLSFSETNMDDPEEGTVLLDKGLVRAERKQRGWSQLKLSEKADVSLTSIERVERGERVEWETGAGIGAAFNIPIEKLLAKDQCSNTDQTLDLTGSGNPDGGHNQNGATLEDGAGHPISGSGPGLAPSEKLSWGKLTLLVLGLAIVLGIVGISLSPELTISRVTLFDEAYSEGPVGSRTLSSLHHRGNSYFEIKNPDDFLLVIGFLITGYAKDRNGNPELDITLTGTPSSPDKKSWDTNKKLSYPEAWGEMLVPQSVTSASVLREFAVVEGRAMMPVIAAVQCALPSELADWTGNIQIKVEDLLTKSTATAMVKLDLRKAISSPGPRKCE